MRTSRNLGSFNRFVTLLFHGDWLFLFLFLFLSIEYSRRSHRLTNRLADRRNLKSVLPVKWKVRIRGSWQKQLFANEKALLKFCMPRNERKKELLSTRKTILSTIFDQTYVPSKCAKKFSFSHSFFPCFSHVSPYTLSLSTSRAYHCV